MINTFQSVKVCCPKRISEKRPWGGNTTNVLSSIEKDP